MSALIFLDTEMTGLSLDDDIWEIAAVRRDGDGTEREFHCFVEHSAQKCRRLPEPFLSDHRGRYRDAISPKEARAGILDLVGGDRPHVVGAVPDFDTQRLRRLIDRNGPLLKVDPWHYHLIDIENLAVGYLLGVGFARGLTDIHDAVRLPWDSDALSRAVGVEPSAQGEGRHTAMGDVRWAMALYDAIIGRHD